MNEPNREVAIGQKAKPDSPQTPVSPNTESISDRPSLQFPWPEDTLIVWIGRFLHKGGYGMVTRNAFTALKDANCPVVGIDAQTCRPIDDSHHDRVDIEVNENGLELRAKREGDRVVIIFNEVPPEWGRLNVAGFAHKAGYMFTETEQIPFAWKDHMLSMDRVWTATEFNKELFVEQGVPENAINVVPCVMDRKVFYKRVSPPKIQSANTFKFLHVASSPNRKDLGGMVRAYCEAFSADADVSLIIKMKRTTDAQEIQRFITEAASPFVDFSKSNHPHILLLCCDLTDENMADLYSACDVYVSFERGKGWDLPASEAMRAGLPTVGLGWGANTAFQNHENSLVVPPLDKTIATNEDLVLNADLYSGHTWASYDPSLAATAMREMYRDHAKWREKAANAAEQLEQEFGADKIAEIIFEYVSSLESYEYVAKDKARLTLLPRGQSHSTPTKKIAFEKLPEDAKQVVETPYEGSEQDQVDTWIQQKRAIWGKHGPVLPRSDDLESLKSLHNRFAGESIFLIGNAPSLNKIDLSKLKDHYSFGANRIYLKFDSTDWRPDFYTALDWRVTPDNFEDVNRLEDMTFFFPNRFKGLLREGSDVFWYESLSAGMYNSQQFEADATEGVRGGGTVMTAAMQLAYYLGFRRMFLLGVDVSYAIPDSVKQSGGHRFKTGVQLNLESTADDDANHFDPRYFGKGARWHDPNVDAMKRGFQSAYRWLYAAGAELYNSTPGGNLDCMPRLPFEDALKIASKK